MAYWINERPYGKTVSKTDCMSANVPMIPIYILNVASHMKAFLVQLSTSNIQSRLSTSDLIIKDHRSISLTDRQH
jgi:hypothetical protein